ncbi:hypothetical protein [Crenobacter intestini]|uniref:hypothetical protein n=1 Tax=Crenobacter intestini TaxID=2563443 RepID=UPI00196ADD4A|nr:hypothetical protein [Crenobacter intestini]
MKNSTSKNRVLTATLLTKIEVSVSANGDVIQADFNAARNVKLKLHDPEITRFMPHREVLRILQSRSSGATERQEAPVGRRKLRQRSSDKSIPQL